MFSTHVPFPVTNYKNLSVSNYTYYVSDSFKSTCTFWTGWEKCPVVYGHIIIRYIIMLVYCAKKWLHDTELRNFLANQFPCFVAHTVHWHKFFLILRWNILHQFLPLPLVLLLSTTWIHPLDTPPSLRHWWGSLSVAFSQGWTSPVSSACPHKWGAPVV